MQGKTARLAYGCTLKRPKRGGGTGHLRAGLAAVLVGASNYGAGLGGAVGPGHTVGVVVWAVLLCVLRPRFRAPSWPTFGRGVPWHRRRGCWRSCCCVSCMDGPWGRTTGRREVCRPPCCCGRGCCSSAGDGGIGVLPGRSEDLAHQGSGTGDGRYSGVVRRGTACRGFDGQPVGQPPHRSDQLRHPDHAAGRTRTLSGGSTGGHRRLEPVVPASSSSGSSGSFSGG